MQHYLNSLPVEVQNFIETYDFSNALPKVNGKVLKSNFDIAMSIMDLLHTVKYEPSILEPYPPILRNYRDVERKRLVKYGRRILDQLRDGLDIRLCILDIDGFRFFFKHPKSSDYLNGGRTYKLTFEYVVNNCNRSQVAFVPERNLSAAIDKYFNRSELSNKILIIK